MTLREKTVIGLLACLVLVVFPYAHRTAHAAPFTHSPVVAPVEDGVCLAVPKVLGNAPLAGLGLLDVTAAPFNADKTGRTDSTKAIQDAVNFARDNQMVCFFPEGEYRVSDTISCIQNRYERANGAVRGAPNFPCVLYGSRRGERPRIVLAPHSSGFGAPKKPKYVVHFWTRGVKKYFDKPKPNSSYNQTIENLDVVIGEGNPGAVGIRMRAAQGSNVVDCAVHAGDGLAGFEGGPGSGGSIFGLTVVGGGIGMDMRETQPAPTIAGIVLEGQRRAAIIYAGRQSLSAVGVRIRFAGSGPAIRTPDGGSGLAFGQMAISDASIEYEHPARAAIDSDSAIYLSNVYVKGAGVAARGPAGEVPGSGGSWTWIRECAIGSPSASPLGNSIGFPVYVDAIPSMEPYVDVASAQACPEDLVERHLWQSLPSWESPDAVNVKEPPYSARGDGVHDDTKALQRAIDENGLVFLPKGYYLISRPLVLGHGTRLVGVAKHLSIIYTKPGTGQFADLGSPNPLVRTAVGGDAVLSNLCLYAPRDSGSYAIHWRAGEKGMFRFVNIMNLPLKGEKGLKDRSHPFVLIEGQGRWYGLYHHGDFKQQTGDYRLVLVKGSQGPLRFYHANLEHASSDANMEIRDSRDVKVYGLKSEGNSPSLLIRNSHDVSVLGFGGNASALPGKALFIVENSSGIRLVNLINTPREDGTGRADRSFGVGVGTGRWHMVEERDRGLLTGGYDRPVLYLLQDDPAEGKQGAQ